MGKRNHSTKLGDIHMRTRALVRMLMTLASLMTMLAASGANAGLFRSYLSVSGNDANPCTLPSPCRLLPAALAAINDGGEIWMLDSANFNVATVSVTKSVTILAVPGALGSVVANGVDAMNVNASGAKVTLRNVVILNLSGTVNTGISFVQGASLTLEGCELYGLNNGVSVSGAGTAVTIKDTTIRDNASNGVVITGGVRALLRGVSVLNNTAGGVVASNGAGVAIAGSTISGSTAGLQATSSGSTTTQVAVSSSSISGNTTGVQAVATTGSDTAQVVLNNVTVSQSGTGVTITGGTASVYTRQNNTFKFNAVDVTAGGTLTPLAAQ
jgi:hypothetical protein